MQKVKTPQLICDAYVIKIALNCGIRTRGATIICVRCFLHKEGRGREVLRGRVGLEQIHTAESTGVKRAGQQENR